MSLAGRHALVTGAGRGIGAAIARRLAAEGAAVTLVGRSAGPLEAVAAEIGGRAIPCDVTDRDAFAEVAALAGPVDILVNNAGAAETAPFLKSDAGLWQRALEINLLAVVEGTRLFLPGMIAKKWGRVISVASTASVKGYAYVSAYVAAKHAVLGLTRALALEMAKTGVTVNAVCPGYTDTDLVARAVETITAKTGRDAGEAKAGFLSPQGRLVAPGEVADAVAWLAGDGAASVTGQGIVISGGEV